MIVSLEVDLICRGGQWDSHPAPPLPSRVGNPAFLCRGRGGRWDIYFIYMYIIIHIYTYMLLFFKLWSYLHILNLQFKLCDNLDPKRCFWSLLYLKTVSGPSGPWALLEWAGRRANEGSAPDPQHQGGRPSPCVPGWGRVNPPTWVGSTPIDMQVYF